MNDSDVTHFYCSAFAADDKYRNNLCELSLKDMAKIQAIM